MEELLNKDIEKFDCIYIDPLYNAKNSNFKNYNDNIKNWEDFIEKRLYIAQKLLNDAGIISISIGEDAVCQLKLICDKIFGVKNKIAMITVKTPNQTENKDIIKNADYLLIYRKSELGRLNLPHKKQEARCTTSKKSQTINTIRIPEGIRCVNIPDGIYSSPRKVGGYEDLELVDNNEIIVKNGLTQNSIKLKGRWSCPNDLKMYFKNRKENIPTFNKFGKKLIDFYFYDTKFQPRLVKEGFNKPTSIWDGFLSKGKNELKLIIGDNDFAYPKHSELIKYIIEITTSKKDARVLDFFAGSGTTMQAVAELNEKNNTNISCTLITNNENNIIDNITLSRLQNCELLFKAA